VVENVASYRERTTFDFDNAMNILIGPNGGGKTNLQRIVALTISKYLIHQYQFVRDDNNVRIERHDPWNERALKRAFPPYMGNSAADQLIQIELVPEKRDVQNIEAIGGNLSKFNDQLSYWEKKYEVYEPLPFAQAISASPSFTFSIRNLQLEPSAKDTAQGAFAEYLREFFIFLRVAHRVPDVTLSSPVFFFSSERALSRQFDVQAAQLSEQAYFDGYRSAYQAAVGENMNLMQWGAQHFVRLYRRAVAAGSNVKDKTWRDFFYQYDDVKLLTHYLEQLGYTWNFSTDADQLSFSFLLTKDGEQRSTDMFSSGEREIVHFLLAMFALNVRDGLVLVDEPELHLHPRWQRIFLGLFRDVSADRNSQFIVTTHSPVFVTPETIDSVTRIYRIPGKGSSRVALRNVELPEKKNLVRMINSQNNERLFFADKVVLVWFGIECTRNRSSPSSSLSASIHARTARCTTPERFLRAITITEVGSTSWGRSRKPAIFLRLKWHPDSGSRCADGPHLRCPP
jgi:predicted ATPase